MMHRKLFQELQKHAEKQATTWEQKITQTELQPLPPFNPIYERASSPSLHANSVRSAFISCSAMKIRGMSVFHAVSQRTSTHWLELLEQFARGRIWRERRTGFEYEPHFRRGRRQC